MRKTGRVFWRCLAMVGKQPSPPWLETDGLLAAFGPKRAVTIRRYREFVFQGIGGESIWINLKSQVFLGDEDFVAKSLSHADGTEDVNVPRAQRRPPPPSLEEIVRSHPDRNAAIIAAYASGGYSYQDIGSYYGLHFTTVAKIVRQAKTG